MSEPLYTASLKQMVTIRDLLALGHTLDNLHSTNKPSGDWANVIHFDLLTAAGRSSYRMEHNGDCFRVADSPSFSRESLRTAIQNRKAGRG